MIRTFWSVCLLVIAVTPAAAAPLNPADVPKDAKWVIHLDYEALTQTELMQAVRDQWPEKTQQARQWLKDRYGIDPQEDMQGLTMFSDTYEEHTGAAILLANYNRQKVKSDILSKPDVRETKWQDYTFYTWKHEHKKSSADQQQASDEKHGGHPHYGDSVTIVLVDRKTVVFAPSVERAKSVVKLLDGESPSLQDIQSPLVDDVSDGAVLYGAAIDLDGISRHEGVFPILQQHQRIVYELGEHQGKLFENTTFVAQSEEVAEQMKTAVEGFVAFARVWAGDSESLTNVLDDVKITRNGATVESRLEAETKSVLNAIADLRTRLEKMRQLKSDREEADRDQQS